MYKRKCAGRGNVGVVLDSVYDDTESDERGEERKGGGVGVGRGEGMRVKGQSSPVFIPKSTPP